MITDSNILLLSLYSMEDSNDSLNKLKFSNKTTPLISTTITTNAVTSPSSVETLLAQQQMTESVTTTLTDTTTSETVITKKREKFSKDSNGERIRDEKGYRLRAAGLCTRLNKNCNTELLLVSGRGNSNSWVVPGGGIEEDENAQQAAIREVHEEAGIRATIRSMVGEFKDDERLNRTILYELNVIEEYEDWEDGRNGRLRSWFTIPEALEKIKSSQRVMLQKYISD
jgi:8-oxo-dGTP pyrophosphatase MutT (NUDIX family)